MTFKPKICSNCNKRFSPLSASHKICQSCKQRTCRFCKKKFHVYDFRKNGCFYCSPKCYLLDRWRGNGKCKNCGSKTNSRYCSNKCLRNYNNKNGFRLYAKKRYWKRRIELIKSLGGKCLECGVSDIRVLDIHHKDPGKKLIPKDRVYNYNNRMADWNKNAMNLELMCSNCHRILTWNMRGFGKIIGFELDV